MPTPYTYFHNAFQSAKSVSYLFFIKDRVPETICSSFVYKLTCHSFEATYFAKPCGEQRSFTDEQKREKDQMAPSDIRDHVQVIGHHITPWKLLDNGRSCKLIGPVDLGNLLILRDSSSLYFHKSLYHSLCSNSFGLSNALISSINLTYL